MYNHIFEGPLAYYISQTALVDDLMMVTKVCVWKKGMKR